MYMKEQWKSIKGYDGYEVSDLGRVRSLNYNHTGKVKVLRPRRAGAGYMQVVFCKNGEKKRFYVHSLVITTFRGPIPKGMQVNHINENKRDNRLSNLEVVTHKENQNHGTRNERLAKSLLGNTNGSKKLELTLVENPYTKYTFKSSYEASNFFKYRSKKTVGILISAARKRNETFINIRKTKYYFSQET